MYRNKVLISRILNDVVVDGCIFKTRLRYYTNTGYIAIVTDYTITKDKPIKEVSNKEKRKAYYKVNRDKYKTYYEDNKDKIKAYYEDNRDPNIPRMGSKEHSIALSCGLRHVDIKDFNGFFDKNRPYITPIKDCIEINKGFNGSHAHHITKSIIIYIPKELHRHIKHNIRTGENMGEINALAIQFVNSWI